MARAGRSFEEGRILYCPNGNCSSGFEAKSRGRCAGFRVSNGLPSRLLRRDADRDPRPDRARPAGHSAGVISGRTDGRCQAALLVGTSTGRHRSGSRKTTSSGRGSSQVGDLAVFRGGGMALLAADVSSR
jgi:hypothetical protein